MRSEGKRTPGPWTVSGTGYIFGNNTDTGRKIVIGTDIGIEDAAFIVKAVNAYDGMLEALKKASQALKIWAEVHNANDPVADYLDEVIAKSEPR